MSALRLSNYHVATPPFLDIAKNQVRRVVFATRTAEARVIPEEVWTALTDGAIDVLPLDTLQDFVDIELFVPSSEDELSTILKRNNAAAADDTVLYTVIQPTAACQLGCGYCGQLHSPNALDAHNQSLLIERVARKLQAGSFQTLHVCWFGAEPIAGKQVIRALTPRLISVAAEHGCDYEARIVTNGLALTDQIAEELVREHKVGFIEVTLDGSASFHDARRHTKAGHPTFARIFKNVVSLARRVDLDVSLRIRCNVDRRNFEGVPPLLHMLEEAGIQERISFYVAPIHSWGNDAHKESLELNEFAERELDWYVEASKLGFAVPLLPGVNPVVCMAIKPSAELIDAYGNVFNCTEVSYVPLYGTPNRFALGTLEKGTGADAWHVLGDFNTKIARQEYPCATCRMLPVCGGSCPKQWLEGHIPCPSTKLNIEGRLLLAYAKQRIDSEAGDLTRRLI